ncbi:MAG: 3-deoxy-7-phosphoheptulonate synthase [Planctomycetes bacterium]|nr:3-deoxy-7-phosphoheptulonate synthase [Planctomycetota bacterium]NUQ34429.1 3-deoxy-7-phosphoheptulonate synthase [Planctomycetaceae bacterium]
MKTTSADATINTQPRAPEPAKTGTGTRVIDLGDSVTIGGLRVAIMAGPCAIETVDQLQAVADSVKKTGASILRGGVYKMRTAPQSFQGLGEKAFKMAADICRKTGLKFVTEAVDEQSLDLVDQHADMIQIGTRNMHNSALLKRAGKCKKPVLLKRGFSATIEEFLLAADYILQGGNTRVILCERGIRTFNTYSRYTLDLNLVPALRERTPLPVMVDVSHGTGKRTMVPPMALAAIACGADGVMMEVHHAPDEALSDGAQSLAIEDFETLVPRMRSVAEAIGRTL